MPAFQFYPGDWLRDPELSRCSKAARGVWIDMLCRMFDCDSRGVLATGGVAWSDQEVAESIGGDSGTNLSHIQELLLKKVARRNDAGAIYSKRMVRDEQDRQTGALRTAKFRANGGGDPARWTALRVPILERDQYICAYCGKKAITVDHVNPKSKGGTEEDGNLVACCKGCNMRKSDRTPEEANMSFCASYKHARNTSLTPLLLDSSSSSSTSKQKQKPGTALAMPDPRHSEISVHIQSLYTKATTVYPAPWGKGEAGALALLLKSNPSWTAAHIKRLVDNRFSSEENHADPPRLWITRLPAYAQPLDRYGKPIQKANGAAIGMDREITPESRDLTARQLAANIEWLRKKKADGKTLNEFEERMLQEHSHA